MPAREREHGELPSPRERKVRTPKGRVLDNVQEGQPYGKCHRKHTAPNGVRVKWRGKSSPPRWRHRGQGKPHPEQGQIEGRLRAARPMSLG